VENGEDGLDVTVSVTYVHAMGGQKLVLAKAVPSMGAPLYFVMGSGHRVGINVRGGDGGKRRGREPSAGVRLTGGLGGDGGNGGRAWCGWDAHQPELRGVVSVVNPAATAGVEGATTTFVGRHWRPPAAPGDPGPRPASRARNRRRCSRRRSSGVPSCDPRRARRSSPTSSALGQQAELPAGVQQIGVGLDARGLGGKASRSAWISSSWVPAPERVAGAGDVGGPGADGGLDAGRAAAGDVGRDGAPGPEDGVADLQRGLRLAGARGGGPRRRAAGWPAPRRSPRAQTRDRPAVKACVVAALGTRWRWCSAR
jgi:hypothetical protein